MRLEIGAATDPEREWAARLMASSEPWTILGRTLEQCRAILTGDDLVFVARDAGRPLGFVILDPRGLASSPYVRSIAVAAEARGRGVGTHLMRFAEEHFRPRARHIFLCVSSFNARARALYERLGYDVIGELPDYWFDGASEFLLHKRLTGGRPPRSPARGAAVSGRRRSAAIRSNPRVREAQPSEATSRAAGRGRSRRARPSRSPVRARR
jgi:ribosomal-protein-alanine N-acetyltransferase